mgnify:CR=1 FL=1
MFIPFFSLVWLFIELKFVAQIDPRNESKKLILMGFGLIVVYIVFAVGAAIIGGTLALILGLLGFACMIGAWVCLVMGMFKVRSSLLQYYNSVEPIGLRLSGVMTFFFNVIYFQYHFQRIADWKKTGQLRPQN